MAKKPTTKGAAAAQVKAAMASVPGMDEWLADNKDSVTLLSDTAEKVDVIPTGNILIDWAVLQCGGIPRGRVTEVYGPESSGKTTLCLHTVVNAQKRGIPFLYIDSEHDFDPRYFESLGGSVKGFPLSQPSSGDECFDIAISALRKGWPGLIVFDSVATMAPKMEIEGDMDVRDMGVHAKLMSKGLRKIRALAADTNCALMFVNQTRSKVGVVFGSPETTTGGNALKFYSSLRLEIRNVGRLNNKGEAYGNSIRVRAVKNKLAPPFTEAVVDSIYGLGFSNAHALFELAALNNVVVKQADKTNWEINGQKYRGRQNAVEAFVADPFLQSEVEEKLIELIKEKKAELPSKGDKE